LLDDLDIGQEMDGLLTSAGVEQLKSTYSSHLG
jgi:hypothetical protein